MGGGRKNVLKLLVVMVAQLCKYTKNHSDVYFKGMAITVSELNFNKAVVLNSKHAQPVFLSN